VGPARSEWRRKPRSGWRWITEVKEVQEGKELKEEKGRAGEFLGEVMGVTDGA
jgi:hypothetical protein